MRRMRRRQKDRSELSLITRSLRLLSRQPVPRMTSEAVLRERLRAYLTREGRFGLDESAEHDIGRVIDSHVGEMRAELLRFQAADEAGLSDIEVKLDGLAARCQADEARLAREVADLRYQRRSAERVVEDPDTPAPAGRYAGEESGYRYGNVGELAGRGVRKRITLWVVLALALIADVAAFRQVVERVLNDQLVLPMVVALTALTAYLAHRTGDLFKTARETSRTVRRAIGAWTLLAVWGAVGAGMFVFRLLAPPPPSGVTDSWINAAPATATGEAWTGSGAGGDLSLLSALLLLLLYVLTGAIAISAGYQRPRPEIEQYRRSGHALRRKEKELAHVRQLATEASTLRMELAAFRERRRTIYAHEMKRCEEVANGLKAEVATMIRRMRRIGWQPWYRRLFGYPELPCDDARS